MRVPDLRVCVSTRMEVEDWVASSQGFLKVYSSDKQGELLLSSHGFYLPPCPPPHPHFPFQILPTVTVSENSCAQQRGKHSTTETVASVVTRICCWIFNFCFIFPKVIQL